MTLNPHIAVFVMIIASLTVMRIEGYGQDNQPELYYKKGSTVLDLNFPYVNAFSFSSEKMGDITKAGFLGAGLGVDFYTSEKSYIGLTGKVMTNFFLPFPAPVKYGGEHNFLSSSYVAISSNHVWREFHFGYGLAFGRNSWSYKDFGSYNKSNPDSIMHFNEPRDERRNVLGFITSLKYQFPKSFYIAVTYRPTFIQFVNKPIWRDEHLVSLEFGWRIRVIK